MAVFTKIDNQDIIHIEKQFNLGKIEKVWKWIYDGSYPRRKLFECKILGNGHSNMTRKHHVPLSRYVQNIYQIILNYH